MWFEFPSSGFPSTRTPVSPGVGAMATFFSGLDAAFNYRRGTGCYHFWSVVSSSVTLRAAIRARDRLEFETDRLLLSRRIGGGGDTCPRATPKPPMLVRDRAYCTHYLQIQTADSRMPSPCIWTSRYTRAFYSRRSKFRVRYHWLFLSV